MNKYYRPKEVANLLGIGLSTFWLYVEQNKLVTQKLSKRVTVVSEDELKKFISRSES